MRLYCSATESCAFSTRLRTCFAKNSSLNCFLNARSPPLGFKSICSKRKKTAKPKGLTVFLWQGQKDKAAMRLYCSATESCAFSTRLRTCFAKNSSLNCFLNARSPPLGFKSICSKRKKTAKPKGLTVFLWQGQKDLNPRHVVLETTALPTELYP